MAASTPMQRLLNALSEAAIVLNRAHGVEWYNHAAANLLDSVADPDSEELQELIAHPLFQQLRIDDPTSSVELTLQSRRKLTISVSLVSYDDFLLVLIRDMTHLHQLESVRQHFVANVSHELRTPLTVFHGYLTILQQQTHVAPEKLASIINDMMLQTQRMESLVEDLLLLSRLEAVEPDESQYHAIELAPLIRRLVADAEQFSAGQHEFHVQLDESAIVNGQEDELHSAFANLLFNAVRYTQEGGRIDVRVDCDSPSGQVCVRVKDNGIGISEKHIERITQRFYRVDKSRTYRGKGGTGLGLAIVKHVLQRHHAQLIVESELDQGSVFVCVFSTGAGAYDEVGPGKMTGD